MVTTDSIPVTVLVAVVVAQEVTVVVLQPYVRPLSFGICSVFVPPVDSYPFV